MGAIYGIVGDADAAELQAIGRRLAHRGIDGGEWSWSSRLHLGQRFFPAEIGAKSPGRPVVFDGALSNGRELAELTGCKPSTADDPAELLLRLFHEMGPECFAHLRGTFAAAIWDERTEGLYLARDFWGARSLFYAQLGERLLFASEYKALLAVDEVPARPNREAIQFVNRTKAAMTDACCLEDVYPVPNGCWILLRGGEVEKARYWAPSLSIIRRAEAEHVATFREAILDATRLGLDSYKRVGVLLSGGIDSAVVLAAIRSVAPSRSVHTFSAGFGPDDPELELAAASARAFGATHHECFVPADQLPGLLPAMTWHLEEPVGREDNPYLFACAREAAGHVDVLVGGHVADILLGGMPRYMLVKAAAAFPPARPAFEDLYAYTRSGANPRTRLGRLLLSLYFRDGGTFAPPQVAGAPALEERPDLRGRGAEPLSEFLLRSVLAYQGKGHYDRLHSAFGIALDAPFMERELVQLAFALPDRFKIRGRTQKWILREAMKDLLPTEIARRRKSLARLRHDTTLTDVLEAMAEDLLAPSGVRARGLFDPAYVERARRRRSGAPYPKEQLYRLWSLLLTEIWCRIFVDQRGARPR